MAAASGLGDIEGLLPKAVQVSRMQLNDGDVLIAAPGFEDRTLAICNSIQATQGASAILLEYLPSNPENQFSDVAEQLAQAGVQNQSSLTYDRFNPADFEQRLHEELAKSCRGLVLVDISTMSKLAIILVLKSLAELPVRVVIFYSEAKAYGPNEQEFEDAKTQDEVHRPSLQIFSGIHGIVRVDSLASVAMQGQPTAAMAFMSFNDALTQSLLNTVYPARLFLINGRPPIHSWREHATAWIHDQVRLEWPNDNPISPDGSGLPVRSVSTLDYRETVVELLELYWRLSTTHRMLLAPAGSKFQAVGCFIVKTLHPDIHIEYPSPQGYLNVYSKGIGRCWQLELGIIRGLINRLAAAERDMFLQVNEGTPGVTKEATNS